MALYCSGDDSTIDLGSIDKEAYDGGALVRDAFISEEQGIRSTLLERMRKESGTGVRFMTLRSDLTLRTRLRMTPKIQLKTKYGMESRVDLNVKMKMDAKAKTRMELVR